MKWETVKRASTEHEAVYHAARGCQAAALSLTAARLRGRKKACSGEQPKTLLFLAAHRSEGAVRAHRVDLGGVPGMRPLWRPFKNGCRHSRLLGMQIEPERTKRYIQHPFLNGLHERDLLGLLHAVLLSIGIGGELLN